MNNRKTLMKGRAGVPARFWDFISCPVELLNKYIKEGWIHCPFKVANPKIIKRKDETGNM